MSRIFNSELQCVVYELAYDFTTRTGTLRLPRNTHCDMHGCISLFQRIDDGVERINAFSGDKLATTYGRRGQDWVSD